MSKWDECPVSPYKRLCRFIRTWHVCSGIRKLCTLKSSEKKLDVLLG
jgi:hypothetical protein